jgi:hypothetical protein
MDSGVEVYVKIGRPEFQASVCPSAAGEEPIGTEIKELLNQCYALQREARYPYHMLLFSEIASCTTV